MNQVIKFSIINETYCVSIDNISEIVDIENIKPLSVTDDYVIGITDIRDDVVEVVNTAEFINEDKDNEFTDNISDKNLLYFKNSDEKSIGLLVSSVQEVMKVSEEEIRGDDLYENDNSVKSIIKKDGDMIVWLDLSELGIY